MEAVVARFYLDAIETLPTWRLRRRARQLCEYGLLSPEGYRESLGEGQITRNYGLKEAYLDRLVDAKVLRRETRLEAFSYELSHDSLAQAVVKKRRFRLPTAVKISIGVLSALLFMASAAAYLLVQVAEVERQEAVLQRQWAEAQRRAAAVQRQFAGLELREAEIAADEADAKRLLAELERQRAELTAEGPETERQAAELQRQREEAQQRTADVQRQFADLQRRRAEIEAEEAVVWRQLVEVRVTAVVAELLGVKKEEVTNEASFVDDLGADSLDTVELVMALEEEFNIEIPDEEAEKIVTVQDAVSYIEETL